MKRGKGLIVLALIVAMVCFTSCSGDIRKTFSNMMGGLSGNIYEQMNLATPSTAAAASVVASVSTPATTTTTGDTTTVGGVSVTVTAGTTLVSGASEETINNLSEALNSNDTSASKVKEALKQTVSDSATQTAVNNTRTLANDALTALSTNDKVPDAVKKALKTITIPLASANMTQNDVLQTQLLMSAVETVADVATKTGVSTEDYVTAMGKVVSVVKISESLGGSIITTDTLTSLVNALTSSSGGKSRSTVLDPLPTDFKYYDLTNSLCKSLFGLMTLEKDGDGYKISEANWNLFLNNLSGSKSLMELALSTVPNMGAITSEQKKQIDFALTNIVPYIIGSVISEVQKIYTPEELLTVVNDFLKNNKEAVDGTLSSGYQFTFTNDLATESVMRSHVQTYLSDETTVKARWKSIVSVVKYFNKVAGSSSFDKYFSDEGSDSLFTKINDLYKQLSEWTNKEGD
jgi:hypothetical protein